ncbi:TlpA family protein disulfide reductase [Hanstruepera marina]|uniref:TlpA family protein disulfide reductase n=1 Tax=Hanstruepera marina TaxID=2873265 RepID=UPI001CA61198|nr:TlpA family protein disulfide reductase [Hanstruepera marina]
MKPIILILIVFVFSCKEAPTEIVEVNETTEENSKSLELEINDYAGLEPYLNLKDDHVYVVNFWATWCAPCVKELPFFEQLGENYKDNNVKVVLISLDFPKDYESKLIPFIEKNKLQSKILVLDDPDMNSWIPKVNPDWEGAIPATLIYNKDKKQFYEQSFTYEELKTEVNKFLN